MFSRGSLLDLVAATSCDYDVRERVVRCMAPHIRGNDRMAERIKQMEVAESMFVRTYTSALHHFLDGELHEKFGSNYAVHLDQFKTEYSHRRVYENDKVPPRSGLDTLYTSFMRSHSSMENTMVLVTAGKNHQVTMTRNSEHRVALINTGSGVQFHPAHSRHANLRSLWMCRQHDEGKKILCYRMIDRNTAHKDFEIREPEQFLRMLTLSQISNELDLNSTITKVAYDYAGRTVKREEIKQRNILQEVVNLGFSTAPSPSTLSSVCPSIEYLYKEVMGCGTPIPLDEYLGLPGFSEAF